MTDPIVLATLAAQVRALDAALARLERARDELIPDRATFWQGSARAAFDAAVDGLLRTVIAGTAALRAARDHTARALAQAAEGAA